MGNTESKIEEVCGPLMDEHMKALVTAIVAPINEAPSGSITPEMLRADAVFKALQSFVSTSHGEVQAWTNECIHVAHELWRSGLYSAEVFAYVVDNILCD